MFARFSIALMQAPARCFNKFFHKGPFLKGSVEVRMPSLSPTMTQGNIVKWHKKEGDSILPGDLLCEIQTDKAVLGLEVEEEGTLAKILKGDNSTNVTVGALIALIAEGGTDWKTIEIPDEVSKEPLTASPQIGAVLAEPAVQKSSGFRVLGPAAKQLIDQYNIDPSKVQCTGPHGILLKGDLLKYIKEKDLKVAVKKPAEPISAPTQKITKPKKVDAQPQAPGDSFSKIAPRPQQGVGFNKISVPHSYSSVSVCMDAAQSLCEEFKRDKITVEYLDILIKAAAVSLKKHPNVNALWSEQGVQFVNEANISCWTELEDANVIQEIKDAASLSVEQISANKKNFREQLHSKGRQNLESSQSSFLIYYLESIDITSFHSIVSPPHTSCLSAVAPRFVLDGDCSKKLFSTISLSVDNRVIDDVDASNFLESLKQTLENPMILISHHPGQVDVAKLFAK